MEIQITPGNPLRGALSLPGDKSISHRAALFAGLAGGQSQINNFLLAGVTQPLLDALTVLGVEWNLSPADEARLGFSGPTLWISGQGIDRLQPPTGVIDCLNSGTTIRFLTGALAAAGLPAVLDGSVGLRRRPMARIVDPLQAMGVPIQASEGGVAPLILERRPAGTLLQALDYRLPVASAQVKTALVLAALRADGTTHLIEPQASRDHTERMLASMGAEITTQWISGPEAGNHIYVSPMRLSLTPIRLTIPGDISSASFLIVAGLITPGSEITLQGVGLNPTRTGLLRVLSRMGADIEVFNERTEGGEPSGDLVVRHSSLKATQVSGAEVVDMIDEFPIFGVAAAFAAGKSEVSNAEELRYKESDRIARLCGELGRLGVDLEEKPDGFYVKGNGKPQGGRGSSHGDHRLEMALAVAGLAAQEPTQIQEAGTFSESFPGFLDDLQALGAEIQFK